MIVVPDASVLVAALVDSGPAGAWAESRIGEGRLVAPELAPAEVLSVLRKMEAAGAVSSIEAAIARDQLLELPVSLYPLAPFAHRIWALRRNLTPFDAWYVALAEAIQCPVATLDARLARAPGPKCDVLCPSPADAAHSA